MIVNRVKIWYQNAFDGVNKADQSTVVMFKSIRIIDLEKRGHDVVG
jgi:hypothetical protein